MTTVNSATTAPTTTTSGTSASSSSSAISSDFDTFLKMLTTQLENQDPLNPVESTDFAVQLATFSGVEQQTLTNQLLESMTSQLGLMGMAQLAGWVGMEARVAAPVYYEGQPVTLAPNPASGADTAILIGSDSDGNEVYRQSIPVSADTIEWNGTDNSGATLPEGSYSFTLESYNNGTLLSNDEVEAYTRIVEAQGTSDGTVLVLKGGSRVTTDDITALRETP